jgi:hypothetical protein
MTDDFDHAGRRRHGRGAVLAGLAFAAATSAFAATYTLDVPCPSAFADWIEQLAPEGITGGCGGGDYCPSSNNTRGQMAVFVTKTFNLQ